MKFDYIIGNPPYQEESAGAKLMDKPVYNYFMDAAYSVGKKVILITPARFLYNAGATPSAWNSKMLEDPHLKVEWHELNSSNVFPNTDIKGGVAVTYHDVTKDFNPIDTFTPYDELNSVRKKVVSTSNFSSLMDIMHVQNNFNLEVLLQDHPEFKNYVGSGGKERRITSSIFHKNDIFKITQEKDDIAVMGIINNKRVTKYLDKKYIADNGDFKYWKVVLPKNNGSGAIGEVLSTPLIGEPLIGYTQSYIGIGAFDSKNKADSCLKYIKTKFARAMLGILKVTQNGSRNCYKFVPLQDFTENSDIDWSESIHGIDLQLYEKYGLDEKEIEFIETHVKEMA